MRAICRAPQQHDPCLQYGTWYKSCMAMLTYNYRIKDSVSRKHLMQMASSVNYVWNYCNDVSIKAFQRDRIFLSAYDLDKLTTGTSKDLRLHSQTTQAICSEYVTGVASSRKSN